MTSTRSSTLQGPRQEGKRDAGSHSQPVKALEEEENRKERHELRGQVIAKDGESETGFRDCIPRALDQVFHLDGSQLTEEHLARKFACQQHEHLPSHTSCHSHAPFDVELTKACRYRTAREALDFVR